MFRSIVSTTIEGIAGGVYDVVVKGAQAVGGEINYQYETLYDKLTNKPTPAEQIQKEKKEREEKRDSLRAKINYLKAQNNSGSNSEKKLFTFFVDQINHLEQELDTLIRKRNGELLNFMHRKENAELNKEREVLTKLKSAHTYPALKLIAQQQSKDLSDKSKVQQLVNDILHPETCQINNGNKIKPI